MLVGTFERSYLARVKREYWKAWYLNGFYSIYKDLNKGIGVVNPLKTECESKARIVGWSSWLFRF